MTPEERIDAALDSVLKASGTKLKNYTMQLTLDRMREAMRKVMSASYIQGTSDHFEAMKKARHNAPGNPRAHAGAMPKKTKAL